ncbi:MAG: histidine triad nucleotide-binding protein [Verrucomicrobiota bacterium]
MTLFERIIAREIPAQIFYEDELCIAIHDINPQAPTHLLIIPKKLISRIALSTKEDKAILGHLIFTAGELAKKLGVDQSGFRVVINNGPDAGETVPHLHVHLLAGRSLHWPPG